MDFTVHKKIYSVPSILVLTGYYLPGYKGGGPIRTVANMLQALGKEFHFSLATSDRDLGDTAAYSTITSDAWTKNNGTEIIYLSPGGFIKKLNGIISNNTSDVINLNSFFSFRFSILPLIFWRIHKPGKPIIIGPRGEFSPGALALKSSKKKFYVTLAKVFGLYKNVIWHASTEHEAADIRRVMGTSAKVRIAIDIAQPGEAVALAPREADAPLRIVFISRISPMKNLLGAIAILQRVKQPVIFDVYGPAEDEDYWLECKNAAELLPKKVTFNYFGMLHPNNIPDTLARYDLFFFPTLGENFGHVIAEALSAGLPVLISDTTPWRDLAEKSLGWDIPLDQPDRYVASIEACCKKTPEEYNEWRKQIRAWAVANIGNQDAIEQNRQLFMNLK